jgi:hypothetical protein
MPPLRNVRIGLATAAIVELATALAERVLVTDAGRDVAPPALVALLDRAQREVAGGPLGRIAAAVGLSASELTTLAVRVAIELDPELARFLALRAGAPATDLGPTALAHLIGCEVAPRALGTRGAHLHLIVVDGATASIIERPCARVITCSTSVAETHLRLRQLVINPHDTCAIVDALATRSGRLVLIADLDNTTATIVGGVTRLAAVA